MGAITVKGKIKGKQLKVVFELDGNTAEILFNGKTDFSMESELMFEIENRHPIGGTYFPLENSPEYYLAGCYYFFDEVLSVESKGVEFVEMENEKGVVY